MNKAPDPSRMFEQAELVSARLALLGNPRRLMILCKLAEGEHSVGALGQAFDLSQSALSQHLAKLRQAKMVVPRRDGQTIYYRIGDDETRRLMEALYDVFCGQDP